METWQIAKPRHRNAAKPHMRGSANKYVASMMSSGKSLTPSMTPIEWNVCVHRAPFNWSHFALLVNNTVRRSTPEIIQGSDESSSGGEHDNSRAADEEAGLPDG